MDNDREHNRHHERHRGCGMERIWENISDRNPGGDRERSVGDWDGKRDLKHAEKRGDDQERAQENERGRDNGRSNERVRARIRD